MNPTEDKITTWFLANNGLRNPNRVREGFLVYANSPFVGDLRGENEQKFMALLEEKGVTSHSQGKDPSGSMARKWRLVFDRFGFIYHKFSGAKSSEEQDALGPVDDITPFGQSFLLADTPQAVQEHYLRAETVEKEKIPGSDLHFSPLRWILAIMLELENRTGTSELSRLEFGLWGHTTNPSYYVDDVVNSILELRARRESSPAKKRFDRQEVEKRSDRYKGNPDNLLDYGNTNMRYLRMTGLIQRKGRGIILAEEQHALAELLAKDTPSDVSQLEAYQTLCNGAPLPSDELATAKVLLKDLQEQLKKHHITPDISGTPQESAQEVNNARHKLEAELDKFNELQYAKEQAKNWKEISDYMTLLEQGLDSLDYDEDNAIDIPKEERATYLEWVIWRAALAIDHLVNAPSDVRGFSLDTDFLPVTFASGGRGDLYCEFEDFVILAEVTLSTSSRQEAMEGEPVRRHVSDAVLKYAERDKPVYGMFIAIKIDTNTAETFRQGVWYAKDDRRQKLKIVPFTLAQFRTFFCALFESETSSPHPDELRALIEKCLENCNTLDAPSWKVYIDNTVQQESTNLTCQ